jgi:putative transposase
LLGYKMVVYRSLLVVADRFFPSSRLHGACGAVNHALTLADRTWVCQCGAVIDRDRNAADNLEGVARASREFTPAELPRGDVESGTTPRMNQPEFVW